MVTSNNYVYGNVKSWIGSEKTIKRGSDQPFGPLCLLALRFLAARLAKGISL